MSTTQTVQTAAKPARFALFIAGIAAIAFGIAVLVWPAKAAVALTAVIASYVIVTGIFYLIVGLFGKNLGIGGRIGHILLGILSIAAGIIAFGQLQASAAVLAIFLTVMVGAMWIVEGFVSLFSLGASSGSKILTIIFAIVSIIAGFTLLMSPLWGAVILWWLLGISMIVLGALNALRGLFGGK